MALPGLTFATIEQFVDKELGVSDWLTIDQSRIDAFAEVTMDRQWIHVDRARATIESPFGNTIAHGYLSLSLLSYFQFAIGVFPDDVTSILNYGLDRVRFVQPVISGQNVRARLKLLSVEARPQGRKLVKMENTVEIEGEPRPALVAETLNLLIS
jgi:acyl dehydratase